MKFQIYGYELDTDKTYIDHDHDIARFEFDEDLDGYLIFFGDDTSGSAIYESEVQSLTEIIIGDKVLKKFVPVQDRIVLMSDDEKYWVPRMFMEMKGVGYRDSEQESWEFCKAIKGDQI